ITRHSVDGTREYTTDRFHAVQDLARRTTRVVELCERNRLLVCGDLKDGIRRRVDDPLPRALVFLTELLDDLRTRCSLVAEDAAAGTVHERIYNVVRKPVRIRRHRLRRHDAHQLPVTRGRVLPLRPLDQPSGNGRRTRLRRTALEGLDVPEAERFEVREIQASDGAGDVSERVRSLVAVLRGVGKLARTNGVEHDDTRPRHAAILGRS